MNITLFISSLYGGGAERVTCNLANYLSDHGHEVEILTMAETEQTYFLNSNVTTKTLLSLNERKNKLFNVLIRFIKLREYLIKNKEKQAFIVMLPKTIIFLMAFKWMIKSKIIVSERGNPKAYSKTMQAAMKLCAKKADGYVFQTDECQKWYSKYTHSINTIVIPNAINPEFIRARYVGKRENKIVSVGRLSEQKNFELLITAFAKILNSFPDYRLVIYGEGQERNKLESLICSLKLQGKVFLPGNITNIAEQIEKASLFVLSSNFEGMPNSLMEAMSLGLPCISTDCPAGGSRFLVRNGENGLLVPVKDAVRLAEAMSFLLADSARAKEFGKRASGIKLELSPKKIYSRWEEYINMVVIGEKN